MDLRDFLVKMALKLAPALLIIVSFVAILLGIILHAVSINELQYKSPPASRFEPNVVIGDKPTDLVWFLQITDLHISTIGHHEREKDLEEFAEKYIDIVKPDVVLVTGDLTDGRVANTTFSTSPQLYEWVAYSNAIKNTNAIEKTNDGWLDIRGNHDNFNVFRPKDPNTLFRQYSIQGKKYARNYYKTLTKADKNYTFIGVDEVQTPGLKIPFNFIGIVDDQDLTELEEFKRIAKERNSQYTIWFAHYPTSSVASPHEGLRNIIDGPYLCGHFHTIGGLVTQMHATQQPGFVEVELGDWKFNRLVRLAAVDHQLFSFVDVNFRDFPIALMTNPKRTEYSMPKYEPLDRIINSTHIRVIAFSNSTVKKVQVQIDQHEPLELKSSDWPLWTVAWTPSDYSSGLHTASIMVEDENGLKRIYNQDFSMDGSRKEFTLPARVLLRAHFKTSVMSIFFFMVVVCTLPMILLRLIRYRHHETGLKRHYKGTFLFNLQLLSNINKIFIPLVLIPAYLATGPHFIGHMVDEAIGVCFVWGILIDRTFIHTGITYNLASIFLLLIHVPEVVLLTYQVSGCYRSACKSDSIPSIINFKLAVHLGVTALQLLQGYVLHSAYGWMALLTSFQFVWSIAIYGFCWFQCTKLNKSDFILFYKNSPVEEQQALTGQKTREDKTSTSDHSSC